MTNTLVISSYKYGHLAAQAIESALAQTKKFDKIFLVDDGVGDCNNLQRIYPEVTFVVRPENIGTVANFQNMLEKVDTDRVMFLGADNWLRDDTLEILSESDADMVVYDIFITGDAKDEILKRHPNEVHKHEGGWYWSRKGGHHGSMLYNVELAKKAGGYGRGKGQRTEEDMVLFHRMLEAGATYEHIPESLLYYRRHRENYNPC